MNQFSKTSRARLNTCHKDLQLVMGMAIALSPVDFGIAEGTRSITMQQKFFKEGKTQLDGVNKKSKHNYSPSKAVDIYAYVNGKASWKAKDMIFLSGFIIAIARHMKALSLITHEFRWGGNWDKDGEIISDQGFVDLPHFEIIETPNK